MGKEKVVFFYFQHCTVQKTDFWKFHSAGTGFFFRGGGGGGGAGGSPHPAKILPIPPIRHLSPFLDQGLSPPAEVRPRKFEKFKYIFVSNLTTFKLKSTLKSCVSCLKFSKKWPNFALVGSFGFSRIFFASSPPSDFVPVGPRRGPKILSPPHQKFREKTLRHVRDQSH